MPTEQGYPAGLTDPSQFNPLTAQHHLHPARLPLEPGAELVSSRVQREFGRNMLVDVAYVGNRADDLLLVGELQPGGAEQRRGHDSAGGAPADPDFARHHLRVQRRQVALQGLPGASTSGGSAPTSTLLSSLTLSKAKDNGARSLENANGNFPAPQDFNNLDADFGAVGLQPAVQQHDELRLVAAVRHGQALGRRHVAGHGRVVGGWQLAGINRVNAGEPVTLTYTPAAAFVGVGHRAGLPRRQQLPAERHLRSVRAGGPADDHQLVQQGLRRRCRPIPSQPFGNAARNSVRGPNFWQFDLAASARSSRSAAASSCEFRLEAFNLFNRDELPRAERQPQLGRVRHDHHRPTIRGSCSSASSCSGSDCLPRS